MQNLKIYILIKDTATDETLNMDGNFEIFKSFLDGLNRSIGQDLLPMSVTALPAKDPKQEQRGINATG